MSQGTVQFGDLFIQGQGLCFKDRLGELFPDVLNRLSIRMSQVLPIKAVIAQVLGLQFVSREIIGEWVLLYQAMNGQDQRGLAQDMIFQTISQVLYRRNRKNDAQFRIQFT